MKFKIEIEADGLSQMQAAALLTLLTGRAENANLAQGTAPEVKQETEETETGTRKRRTKAEMEAEKAAQNKAVTATVVNEPEELEDKGAREADEVPTITPADFAPVIAKLQEIKGEPFAQAKQILKDHGVKKTAELFENNEDARVILKVYNKLKALIK